MNLNDNVFVNLLKGFLIVYILLQVALFALHRMMPYGGVITVMDLPQGGKTVKCPLVIDAAGTLGIAQCYAIVELE